MYRLVISVLFLTMFAGCVQTRSSTTGSDADRAFWGMAKDTDGTEHFRMGDLLIMTDDGDSQ